MRPTKDVPALTLWSLYWSMDTFPSQNFSSLPLYWHATSYSQQLILPSSKRDIEAWLLRAWILFVTIFRGASPAMTKIITSTGHHYLILLTTEMEYDGHAWVQTPFLWVNCARSSVGEPTMNGAILPMNRHCRKASRSWTMNYDSIERDHQSMNLQRTEWPHPWLRLIWEPNAKSVDELRVSTVTTSYVLIEQIPPTSIGVHTDSSGNLQEATWIGTRPLNLHMDILLERSMPTGIDKSIRWTHLQCRISLRMKHSHCHEHLHERSGLPQIYSSMEALSPLEPN